MTSKEFLDGLQDVPLDCALPETGEQLTHTLTDSVLEGLVQDGQFILAMLPLRPLVSNVELVIKEHESHTFIVTTRCQSNLVALSFGIRYRRRKGGVKYDIHFHGKDECLLFAHVMRHFVLYHETSTLPHTPMGVWVRFPISNVIKTENVKSFLQKRLALEAIPGKQTDSNLVAVEGPIPSCCT